ncbi:MAG: DNA cytosine methyltransferase [Terriglobales bacterium]
MQSVELFSGAGGLALGVARAGFKHLAVVEWDRSAYRTLKENQTRNVESMPDWPVHQCDVREFDYGLVQGSVDLLAGGVPCQPFSIGGKHKGHEDERNMFPEMASAIRRLMPKAVLIENVRGLARPSFSKYFGYIELMLSYPEIVRKRGEEWSDHLSRLERYHTRGRRDGLCYNVVHQVLNAANYGIPQKRERLFFVAIRADLAIEWSFPLPTHCADTLLWEQFRTGEYWERHGIRAMKPSPALRARLDTVTQYLLPPPRKAWRTVRDVISDLPQPSESRTSQEPGLTHFMISGARSYAGHTGSVLDQPAKTLKAGVHGVPGGENMLALARGRVRYFTIRESARLQSFPDTFVFPDSWTESMRQIGNAVPVELAELLAQRLASVLGPKERCLSTTSLRSTSSMLFRSN